MRTTFDQQPPPGPDGILSRLATVREARHELERQEAALVRRARNEGIVWEQIAASLGVTKQAVHRKYGSSRLRRAKAG